MNPFEKYPYLKKVIIYAVFCLLAGILIFNKNGLLKFLKLKSEKDEIVSQVQTQKNEIRKIKKEIDSLYHNDAKIEKVAREKFNMKSPNEKVVKVVEE